jgi:hypothetical protein
MTRKRSISTLPLSDDKERQKRLATPILEIHFDEEYGDLELPIIWITKPFYDLGVDSRRLEPAVCKY